MRMTILSLVIVLATTYVWMTRGFFSALIHMVCVVAAGAIAFAVWEPLGYLLLEQSPVRGTFSFLGGVAWGVALGLPFAISLAVLRMGIDKLLPANAQCDAAVDFIGGGVCGLVSGIITAGMIVLSIGLLRLPQDFMDYEPVSWGTGGNVVRKQNEVFQPWADRLTARLYESLSLTTMSIGEPLAKWYPRFEDVPGTMRMTYQGKGRNTMKPGDATLRGLYQVGDWQRGGDYKTLMSDAWEETTQMVTDLSGEPLTRGYIAGIVVQFNSGARERAGQVVIGNGQVRLVCESPDGEEWIARHPVAAVTQIDDPSRIDYARFRYNATDIHLASVGGASDAVMAFEFAVPAGYRPLAVYVRGTRFDVNPAATPVVFDAPAQRDAAIRSGKMAGMSNIGPVLDTEGRPVAGPSQAPQTVYEEPEIQVSNSLGFTIQKSREGALRVVKEERGYSVQEGEHKFHRNDLAARFLEQNLRIDRFTPAPDVAVVKMNVGHEAKASLLSGAVQAAGSGRPLLVDNNGTRYEPVGFVYEDPEIIHIRYTVGQPIRSIAQLPTLSRSRPDQKLHLLYRVNLGVQVVSFNIDDTVITPFEPPVEVSHRQR